MATITIDGPPLIVGLSRLENSEPFGATCACRCPRCDRSQRSLTPGRGCGESAAPAPALPASYPWVADAGLVDVTSPPSMRVAPWCNSTWSSHHRLPASRSASPMRRPPSRQYAP
jgi:hypothetical protein